MTSIKRASVSSAKRVSFLNDDGSESHQLQRHYRRRFASVTEDDIPSYLLDGSRLLDDQPPDDEQLDDTDADVDSLCWSCARLVRIKSRAVPKSLIELGRGKSCMTSLGVSDDDASMPNPHSLVANYARMLVDDRPRFVETLFRAVKLNKLDVTKILCKIVEVSAYTANQTHFTTFRRQYVYITCFIMAALCNRGAIIFLPCSFYLLLLSSFFSSPNLSGHRLDVYHTSTRGMALVRI